MFVFLETTFLAINVKTNANLSMGRHKMYIFAICKFV